MKRIKKLQNISEKMMRQKKGGEEEHNTQKDSRPAT